MDSRVHPASPGDVTPAWLTDVLRQSGSLAEGRVTGFQTAIIGAERGFTGVIARLALRYDPVDRNAPASLIAKFPLTARAVEASDQGAQTQPSDVARQMVERAEREVAFYRAAGAGLPQLPRCYFGHADIEAGEAVLLLEDLSEGAPGDALSGCTVAEARAVLAAIGDVHARWWADDALPALAWLADWSATSQRRAVRYSEQVEAVLRAYGDRLLAPAADLLRALVEPFERILAGLAAAPETVIHADLHLDNVIFVTAAGGFQAKIIDWQSPSRGAAMLDVAGFIAESLSIDDRRARETELLRGYHRGLLDAGVKQYGFDRLYADYRRALCVRCAGQVGWLARVSANAPSGRERALVDALVDPGNVFAALLDHAPALGLGRS